MSDLPSIPSIPGNIDPQLYQVLTAVKQVLDSSQGNTLVTQNDMTSAISSAIDGVSGQAGIPGQTGANGETGSVGPTGDAYVLDIIGGRTTISYDASGASPLPTMTAFGFLLYKNGVSVTTGLTFSWYINSPGTSLLSGTGSTSTFTPTVASTFDAAKADNVVMLTVNYGGLSFTASEPVAITRIGTTGKSYVAFITGGITNTVYDTGGINPLPAQTAFSCELYENGTLVTPATYAWSVPTTNTLLTGLSSTATFTPTLAATFDRTKGDNRVLLTVTYAGITVKAVQPIVMTSLVLAAVDMTAPVAIGGLTVSSGVLYNFLGWGTLPGNFDHVEVWRSATNDRTVAALIGTSLFTVYADYIPDGVDTVYYYWIRAISKAGVAGTWNAVASAGISAAPLGIGDSQVSSISATKIFALTLSALTANLGDVTAGTLKSPDAMFIVDLVNKFIIVGNGTNNPGSVSPWYGSEYVDVRSGSLTTYQWNGSTYSSSKSLRVIETGVATNGTAVSLTKYYSSQPQIIVSPANLQVYSGANSTQNQTLLLASSGVTGSGSSWSFTPTATLQLSADLSGTTVATDTKTSTTDVAVLSTQQVTAANSTSIHCSVTINSAKGTGSAPNWYNRQVSLRIGYRASSTTGAYTYGATTVVAMGSNTAPDNATISLTGLTAGTWYFVVEYTSANVAGNPTWSDGGLAFTTTANTVNSTAASALVDTGVRSADTAIQLAVAPTMPAFTPISGYSITGVVYTVSYGYYLKATNNLGVARTLNGVSTTVQQLVQSSSGTVTSGTLGVPTSTSSTSFSLGTYSPTATLMFAQATGYTFNSASAQAQVKIFSASAVISSRIANTNTTAISNSFTLNNYYSNIAGTAPLASGTLNWMAIL